MIEGDTPKSSGERPWRTSLGSAIHLALHHNNDAVMAELLRVHAGDALKKWLPDVTENGIEVRQEPAAVFLNVRFRGPNRREYAVKTHFS